MIFPYALLARVLAVLTMLAFAYYEGHSAATDKYLPQIATLRAEIDTADAAAKVQLTHQTEVSHDVAQSTKADVAVIHAHFNRVLYTGSAASSVPVTVSASGVDATCTQSTSPAIDPESCVLDAETVTKWQEWAIKNQLPISTE